MPETDQRPVSPVPVSAYRFQVEPSLTYKPIEAAQTRPRLSGKTIPVSKWYDVHCVPSKVYRRVQNLSMVRPMTSWNSATTQRMPEPSTTMRMTWTSSKLPSSTSMPRSAWS